MERYFAGDPLFSHVLAVLSAMFPAGEEFFVASVRSFRPRVTDPELARQLNRFIGQESNHSRAHRDLNARLAGLGYPTPMVDRVTQVGFSRLVARLLPPRACLALTAGLEHYTATLAEAMLADSQADSWIADEQIRRLLLWHALEESEHKAVAFELFQSVSGNTVLRTVAFNTASVWFVGGLLAATGYSAAVDCFRGETAGLVTSLGRLPRWPFLTPTVLRRLFAYHQRGFHPDQFDTVELIENWRRRLLDAGQTRS